MSAKSFLRLPDSFDVVRDENAGKIELPIPKVLVLYTGGTIGMKIKDGVYSPEPHYFETSLRELVILNDPKLSQAMKSYDPDGIFLYLPGASQEMSLAYYVLEYCPLLDSSCMRLEEYKTIVQDILHYYEAYNGFVILHGTDTMAYTSSYLSFMLEKLNKPVVLTGSQIPIFETRSDARDNLSGALIIAGRYPIPEVTILFNGRLLRGNRSSKVDCQGLNAFDSPNFPPLAMLDYNIQVRWDLVLKTRKSKGDGLSIFTKLSDNVAILRLFPGLHAEMMKGFCQPPIKAIVLQTYGMGNVPIDDEIFMKAIEDIVKSGVTIVNCTQCPKGLVCGIYEAGAALPGIGVISGHDMTIECAMAKLSFVFGHDEWSDEEKVKKMKTELCGEFTLSQGLTSSIYSIPSQAPGCIDAVRCGSMELLVAALEYPGNMNLKDGVGMNSLCYAVLMKEDQMIDILCQNGAQLDLDDINIGIIACRAAAKDDIQMLKCLKQAGATLRERDYSKSTALDVAKRCNSLPTTRKFLETNMSDKHTVSTNSGRSPLPSTRKSITDIVKRISASMN